MELEKIIQLNDNNNIKIFGLKEHNKASELYVIVEFAYEDGSTWSGNIPYYYRRTGLFIEEEDKLIEYLKSIYPLFNKDSIEKFKQLCREKLETDFKRKSETGPIFEKLTNLEWNSVKYDIPNNPNWARRFQDIKEMGYTTSTDIHMKVKNRDEYDTHVRLIPIPPSYNSGYEVISQTLKKRIIRLLGGVNSYDLSSGNKLGLIPDHKFPEIRWDENTRQENPDTMTDDEIGQKFQLLDNQRNQQKREVCRRCFQTNRRGTIFGLNFFYEGTSDWNTDIPKTGSEAEEGCVGCAWYDIPRWREELNKVLSDS